MVYYSCIFSVCIHVPNHILLHDTVVPEKYFPLTLYTRFQPLQVRLSCWCSTILKINHNFVGPNTQLSHNHLSPILVGLEKKTLYSCNVPSWMHWEPLINKRKGVYRNQGYHLNLFKSAGQNYALTRIKARKSMAFQVEIQNLHCAFTRLLITMIRPIVVTVTVHITSNEMSCKGSTLCTAVRVLKLN